MPSVINSVNYLRKREILLENRKDDSRCFLYDLSTTLPLYIARCYNKERDILKELCDIEIETFCFYNVKS